MFLEPYQFTHTRLFFVLSSKFKLSLKNKTKNIKTIHIKFVTSVNHTPIQFNKKNFYLLTEV